MIATAWNNGSHHDSGAGYGLKLDVALRDQLVADGWKQVVLELPGWPHPIVTNIDKDSFRATCAELISNEIGRWLRQHSYAPWPYRQPPRFIMESRGANRFAVRVAGGLGDE